MFSVSSAWPEAKLPKINHTFASFTLKIIT
nr:MAG TPA: hypothetical protein [Caudoviricetes sp.]